MGEDRFRASVPTQRLFIWLTIVGAMLFGIAYMGLVQFFPPPPAYLTAEQVQPLYADHNIRFRIGTVLGLISGGFIIPITIVISVQMARLEKGLPLWAIMQFITGTMGALFIILPFLIWAVAAFTVTRPPELTLLMHEFGWLMFITPLSLFPLQLIGIIVIAFSKDEDDRVSAFPRWLGYLTAWQLVQSFGGPIAILFKHGIFAWAGLLPFWLPFMLFFAWVTAICFTLLRALSCQQRAGAGA